VDVIEDEGFLTFVTELPGLEKDQISISVDNNTLTFSGQRSLAGKREDYHRLERSHGKFERSFSLPNTVESGKIAASLKNGVLTLTLPKKEEAKPRQIEVQVH
ncbi:MAG: Hsp20/alpha crystallin family protein, partial [Acidobacteriota bacterium]